MESGSQEENFLTKMFFPRSYFLGIRCPGKCFWHVWLTLEKWLIFGCLMFGLAFIFLENLCKIYIISFIKKRTLSLSIHGFKGIFEKKEIPIPFPWESQKLMSHMGFSFPYNVGSLFPWKWDFSMEFSFP